MADLQFEDDLTKLEAKETSHRIPVGWALLFWGLIVFGAWYLWAYSPALGGWSQAQDAEGGATAGATLTATILFTVIPTAAAAALWVAFARKKRA